MLIWAEWFNAFSELDESVLEEPLAKITSANSRRHLFLTPMCDLFEVRYSIEMESMTFAT